MERLPIIAGDTMATSPGGELELGIDDAGAKAANVVIEPEAIVGQMLA